MRNLLTFQHAADFLRFVNAGCTDEYGLPLLMVFLYTCNGSVKFLTLRFEYQIVFIITGNGTVGWYHNHIQVINLIKLALFRGGCTRHTCELMVHSEKVLKRNCRIRLCSRFHFHFLFGFNGLMEAI